MMIAFPTVDVLCSVMRRYGNAPAPGGDGCAVAKASPGRAASFLALRMNSGAGDEVVRPLSQIPYRPRSRGAVWPRPCENNPRPSLTA